MKRATAFYAADYLDTDEIIAEYLSAALEDSNPDVFLMAVADVAKAKGMGRIADATGLGRESLYKAFAPDYLHPGIRTNIGTSPRSWKPSFW